MANDKMMAQMSGKGGFIAALDQSGGSTPGALRLYGIPDNAYSGDAEMFRMVHQMRVRIITAPAPEVGHEVQLINFVGGPGQPISLASERFAHNKTFEQAFADGLRGFNRPTNVRFGPDGCA